MNGTRRGLDPPAGRMEAFRMTYSMFSGEPIFSPGELYQFCSKVAPIIGESIKDTYEDLCYLLGIHYWSYTYSFENALKEVPPA